MPEFKINEAFLFMVVYKTSQINYGTILHILSHTEKGWNLTLCK